MDIAALERLAQPETANERRERLGLPALRFHKTLDTSDPETFDLWCHTPEHDTRTLEEFAGDGGYPMFPPCVTELER